MSPSITTTRCESCGATLAGAIPSCQFCGQGRQVAHPEPQQSASQRLPPWLALAAVWWIFDGLRTIWAGAALPQGSLWWVSAAIRLVGAMVALTGVGLVLRWETAYAAAPIVCFQQFVFAAIEAALVIMLLALHPESAILLTLSVSLRAVTAVYVWRTVRETYP